MLMILGGLHYPLYTGDSRNPWEPIDQVVPIKERQRVLKTLNCCWEFWHDVLGSKLCEVYVYKYIELHYFNHISMLMG